MNQADVIGKNTQLRFYRLEIILTPSTHPMKNISATTVARNETYKFLENTPVYIKHLLTLI